MRGETKNPIRSHFEVMKRLAQYLYLIEVLHMRTPNSAKNKDASSRQDVDFASSRQDVDFRDLTRSMDTIHQRRDPVQHPADAERARHRHRLSSVDRPFL